MSNQRPPADCPALENLAAFVDGMLKGRAHARMQAHLASCEACYEVYVETLQFQQEEAEAEQESAPVVPLREPDTVAPTDHGRGPLSWGWVAAAVLAGVLVLVPLADWLGDRSDALPAVDRLVEQLAPEAAAVGDFDGAGWSTVRGEQGIPAGLGEWTRSFRLGVRLVDLEIALRSDDAERARGLVAEVTGLLEAFERVEPLRFGYGEVSKELTSAAGPREQLEQSRRLAGLVAEAVDADALALGSWAELGRLAAESGDIAFLRRRSMRALPQRMAGADLPAEVAPRLEQLDRALQSPALEGSTPGAPSPAELTRLAEQFTALLSSSGAR